MRYMIWTYPIRSVLEITEDDITVSAIACTGMRHAEAPNFEQCDAAELGQGAAHVSLERLR